MNKLYFFLICTVMHVGSLMAQVSSSEILDKMLSSIKSTKTLTYSFKGKERMNGRTNVMEATMKYQTSPKRVYIKAITPDAGTEILLGDGLYGGNAYVNPNKTLLPNIKLDPNGSMLLGDRQHYPVTYAGFDMLYDILNNARNRTDYQIEEVLSLEGSVIYNGRDCYILELTDPAYSIVNYSVQSGDNALKIAKKKFIPAYTILELNPSVKNYFSLNAGQNIKIPSSYAAKTILYIDKKSFLPLYQQMFDPKGEFEKYEYYNIKVNPAFDTHTFSEDNSEYNF